MQSRLFKDKQILIKGCVHWQVVSLPCAWAWEHQGSTQRVREGHKVSSGAPGSLWGMADVLPPLQCAPGFCCFTSGFKITRGVAHKLYSNAMNLGNWSPPQLFGLFTAGEFNFFKTTWILERVLFGLKFELKLVCFCLCHLLTTIQH